MKSFAWGASVNPCPYYLPRVKINPCAAQRRAQDNFLHLRRQFHLWQQYNRRNTLVNPWVCCQGQDKDGPVTQYSLLKIPVSSVSNCLWIAYNITVCVTCGHCGLFIIFGIIDFQILYCVYQLVQFN